MTTILKLDELWKNNGEFHEETNSNYWLYHFENELYRASRRKYGLYDFKLEEDEFNFNQGPRKFDLDTFRTMDRKFKAEIQKLYQKNMKRKSIDEIKKEFFTN